MKGLISALEKELWWPRRRVREGENSERHLRGEGMDSSNLSKIREVRNSRNL